MAPEPCARVVCKYGSNTSSLASSVNGGLEMTRPVPGSPPKWLGLRTISTTDISLGISIRIRPSWNRSTARRSLIGYQRMTVPVAKRLWASLKAWIKRSNSPGSSNGGSMSVTPRRSLGGSNAFTASQPFSVSTLVCGSPANSVVRRAASSACNSLTARRSSGRSRLRAICGLPG